MSRRVKILIGSLVACAVVTASVTAIAQVTSQDPPLVGAEPPTPAVSEDLAANVGVLKTERSAEDVLPATVAEGLGRTQPHGANPNLARKALERNGWTAYVLPANNAVCGVLLIPGGISAPACSSLADLKAGTGSPISALGDCVKPPDDAPPVCKKATVFGVVPDGVGSVTIVYSSGQRVPVAVQNNAYLVDVALDGSPLSVSYAGPAAQVTQNIPGATAGQAGN